MELDQIMKMLKGKIEIKLVKFVSDKGPNSCEECLKHHGEIFQADNPDKPELPIHPNCRCKYELMTQAEVISYQDDLQKIKTQLINYGNQIAAQATQLLAECDEEIKTHTVTHTANAVVTALPAVYQTIKAIEKGNMYSQYNLGLLFQYGLGVTADTTEAVKWYRKSSNQGYEEAKKKIKELGY